MELIQSGAIGLYVETAVMSKFVLENVKAQAFVSDQIVSCASAAAQDQMDGVAGAISLHARINVAKVFKGEQETV